MKSLGRVGEKNLRPHFGVDGLRVHIGEGDAENERTQIIDIRDASEGPDRALGNKMGILAALILTRRPDATIQHAYVAEQQV